MLWASVPEAAVDVDRESSAREDDVDPMARKAWHRAVDEKTKPAPMERRAQCELRSAVAPPLTSHPFPDAQGGGLRVRKVRELRGCGR